MLRTMDLLRKEARKLESTIDLKLSSYSKFGANFAHSSLMRGDAQNTDHFSQSMALEMEQLLGRVRFYLLSPRSFTVDAFFF